MWLKRVSGKLYALWETEPHYKSSKHIYFQTKHSKTKKKHTNPCLYLSSFRYLTKNLKVGRHDNRANTTKVKLKFVKPQRGKRLMMSIDRDHPGQKFAQSVPCWMIYNRGCEQHTASFEKVVSWVEFLCRVLGQVGESSCLVQSNSIRATFSLKWRGKLFP